MCITDRNSTLYTSTHHTIEFPNKGVYAVKEITKAEWTTWIDNSAQSTLKGHTYTLTWASS